MKGAGGSSGHKPRCAKWPACFKSHHLPIKNNTGTSLVGLQLRAPYAGGWGSVPGQRTRSHMLQLKLPSSRN